MNIHQYNLFPNMTLLVYPDLLQVICGRPGATPDEAAMVMLLRAASRRGPRRARSRST